MVSTRLNIYEGRWLILLILEARQHIFAALLDKGCNELVNRKVTDREYSDKGEDTIPDYSRAGICQSGSSAVDFVIRIHLDFPLNTGR